MNVAPYPQSALAARIVPPCTSTLALEMARPSPSERRRKIVGWAAADAMPTSLVARAFERAVAAHQPKAGLLQRSDRGSQYASGAYRDLLRSHGVIPSTSRAGNCYGKIGSVVWLPAFLT